MKNDLIGKKQLIVAFIFSLLVCAIIFISSYSDTRTKIVFCDVGQGDAIYLRIKNKVDVLVDAGPDRHVLDCLGRHMPFFDRKIELAMISHPDKDHIGGFIPVIDRYRVDMIYSVPIKETTTTYKQLIKKITDKKISIFHPFAGYKIKILDDFIGFYWPIKDLSADTNDLSLVFLLQESEFSVLFTGDISLSILERVLGQSKIKIDVLKIPHHGSKYNLSKKILSLADPKIAVISCGKNNSYGHPAREVLEILEAKKIKIRRTDMEGDIVFKLKVCF